MTQQDAVAHWRKGAEDALRSAVLLLQGNQYHHALFLCHLAVEKALKAAWVAERDTEEPPRTHDLLQLATVLRREWTDDQLLQFETLTRFVIDARYAGSRWAKEYGTHIGAETWIAHTKVFLSLLLP